MKTINKIISFLYYSLFIFAPLLMTSKTSELFEFNKIIFIYFITLLILFFWVLKMILTKKIIFKKTVFDLPIIIFLISQIASTFFSIDKHTSFFGYYGRFNGGLLSLFAYLVLYYGFVSNFTEKNIVKKMLIVSLITCFLVILWGLPGKLGYDLSCYFFTGQLDNSCWTDQFRPHERLFSTLGQPNWLGAYLAINFFIILFFLLKNNGFINYLYSILIFICLLFTRSRSALLAVFVALIIMLIFILIPIFKEKRKLYLKKLLFLILLVLVSIFIFKTGISKIDNYLTFKDLNRLFFKNKNLIRKTISKTNLPSQIKVTESLDIRKIVWQGAIELGKRYPFFGTGVETFAYAYYFVRPKAHNLTSEWDYLYNKAHNEYLNYLATTGLIGLGAYLIMIGIVIIFSLKQISNNHFPISKQIPNSKFQIPYKFQITNSKLLITCLFLSYISILITNFFGFSTTTINLFFYLIPAFLIILSQEKLTNDELIEEKSNKLLLSQKIYIFFLLLTIAYWLFFIFKYWLADVNYASSDYYLKSGRYDIAEKLLEKALQLKYEHVYQDKLSYLLANLAVYFAYKKDIKKTEEYIFLARKHNLESLKKSPYNVLYWKTQAKNQLLFYQISLNKKEIEEGIRALKIAKKLSPTDPKIPYSLAVFYNLLAEEKGEDKKVWEDLSLKEITKAIELKNDFRDAYFLRSQLYKKYQQKEKAKKDLEFILEKIDFNDQETKEELKNLN
ncbi:MAG: O-antigen ligase family protein [Patescibacteria group bacterium]|nr:O-antigen ligase family protein [Patescibacteria group bacterium]